jgi:hypothetical protein
MSARYRAAWIAALVAAVACGGDSDNADAAAIAQDNTPPATATNSEGGATSNPCDLFTAEEVATMTGAASALTATPDEPDEGVKSCSWRNRQQEGALLIVDRCDGSRTRGLNDPVPADLSGDHEPCFWDTPADADRVSGIGRQATVFLMTEEGMASYWVANALLDNAAIEVWVGEAAGRDTAVEFLRAAARRLSS